MIDRLGSPPVHASGRTRPSRGDVALILSAAVLFVFSWFLRYNDPEGGYGGLLDDHFYYAIRGWQMLFGELPDRDYVDAGAPLAYGISAALQMFVARGTWSEYIFCVSALSLGASITCLVAARASGSILLGILAALLEIALFPRLYNYPKILVYAVAIPALWGWIARPTWGRACLVAAITAIAFLLRHDHGLYVAAAFAFLLVAKPLPWAARLRQGAIYGAATLLLLAPYLVYLQLNGGVTRHFVTGYRWAQQDRSRDPLKLPTLSWQPLSTGEQSDAPPEEWWQHRPFPALKGYRTWWFFWFAELLPFAAGLLLFVRPRGDPGHIVDQRLRIGAVIALALLVNVGFLRGTLLTQIPDVSVPMSILAVWVLATGFAIVRTGRLDVGAQSLRIGLLPRIALGTLAVAIAAVTTVLLLPTFREQMENSSLPHGIEALQGDAQGVTERLQAVWPLEGWARDDSRGAVQLALYLHSCTAPTDKVLVTPYLAPVVGLARRGFAGGQGDLRSGFFGSQDDQALTVVRLRRQSVPVIIGPEARDLPRFELDLPQVSRYFREEYENLGDKQLGEGLVVSLLVKRTAHAVGTYEPLAFPCFR